MRNRSTQLSRQSGQRMAVRLLDMGQTAFEQFSDVRSRLEPLLRIFGV
jgi:hypothetical protein